ncbi:MAG: ferredoxin--NADP reductase, partial [Acidobacteriota bacterium]
GPYGSFTLRDRPGAASIFIADGVGIGPVRSLVRSLLDSSHSPPAITLVHEAPVPHALAFRSEFEELDRQHPWFRYLSTVPGADSDWHGETRDLTELVPALFEDPAERRQALWYLCGSGRYTDSLRNWLQSQQVEADQIFVERFFD